MVNPDPSHYLILRSCLGFAKGDRIPLDKFREYYTSTAIKSLLEYEYIKIVLV